MRVYDNGRTSAARPTKGSKYTKMSKSDTNAVKDSIKQSRGMNPNSFAPHHPKPKPNLPADRGMQAKKVERQKEQLRKKREQLQKQREKLG